MIHHLIGHEILNQTVYCFVISTNISCVNGESIRRIAKNGNFKMQICEANDI